MPQKFPLGLCIASILMTSMGLSAAALNLQWGTATPNPDALQFSWTYVHIMWALMWLIVWPAISLIPTHAHGTRLGALIAIAIGALPALIVAGFLSAVTLKMIASMLALQGTFSLLAVATLPLPRGTSALLAALAVIGPVLAFIWNLFFPLAWQGWIEALPLIAIVRAARNVNISPMIAAYAIIALAMLYVGFITRPHPTAEA